jgi:hypothetical protein
VCFPASVLPSARSGRMVGVLALAGLLGIALAAWSGGACAQTTDDDQTATSESRSPAPGPARAAVQPARRTGTEPAAARGDDDENGDDDGAASRKPAAAPARNPTSNPQRSPRPETKPALVRDEGDDDEDEALPGSLRLPGRREGSPRASLRATEVMTMTMTRRRPMSGAPRPRPGRLGRLAEHRGR